jgi:hypothetical protein
VIHARSCVCAERATGSRNAASVACKRIGLFQRV